MTPNRSFVPTIRTMILIIVVTVVVYTIFNAYTKDDSFPDVTNTSFIDKELHANWTFVDIKASKDYVREYFSLTDDQLGIHWLRLIKHYIPLPLDSGYGSHQLVLLATSILTAGGGPVIELGCGYYSTMLLHQILVVEQKRYLLSTDTDLKCLSKFQTNMSSFLHQFRHIKATSEWDNVGNDRPRWSFAFIDHKPGEWRVVDVIRLANMSDVVILHDSERFRYRYELALVQYPYRYRYKYLSTNTHVMSKNNATLIQNIQQLLELTIKWKLPK